MSESTIGELFGLKPPKPYTNSKVIPVNNPCPSLLYGLELEIENASFEWENSFFAAKEDGSLRNRGVEYVSQPTTYSVVAHKLKEFFDAHPLVEEIHKDGETSDYSNYSDRTSIHVHTNCHNITLMQLCTIALLYEVFEMPLFRYIGHNRDKNIFCVPWKETTLNHQVISSFKNGELNKIKQWQKYTALNLLPLATQCSIEWRHMHGNNDLKFILGWLRLIGHIYRVAVSHKFDEVCERFIGLNTTSAYQGAAEWVFQDDIQLIVGPGFDSDIEQGVIDFKYAYLDKKPSKDKVYFGDNVVVQNTVFAGNAAINWDISNFVNVARQEGIRPEVRVLDDIVFDDGADQQAAEPELATDRDPLPQDWDRGMRDTWRDRFRPNVVINWPRGFDPNFRRGVRVGDVWERV